VIGYENPYGKPGDMVMMDRIEECLRGEVIGVDVLNQVLRDDCTFYVKSINHEID
jgi:hypothetical protein